MKLLMKMGFKKGEGLGRTGGGVTQALETKLRPKGAGVGVIKEQSEVNIRQGKRIKKMHMEEVRFARLPCPAAQPPSRSSTNSPDRGGVGV